MKLEICINSDHYVKQSVAAAYHGGADTIELCSRMDLDGLTPTPEQIALAREAFTNRPGLMVMIRPRGGDFCYSQAEIRQMELGIETAVSLGADGVVFGAIHNNQLDISTMRRLTNITHKHKIKATCHRAFDAATDPQESLNQLIDIGVARVLTSGTPWGSRLSVSDGIPQLNQLIQQANNNIEIVLGGGIHLQNIREILDELPLQNNTLSVHTYSGVIQDGITNLDAVKELVGITQSV